MTKRMTTVLLIVFSAVSTAAWYSAAWCQDAGAVDDLRQGYRWASAICSHCHVATPAQKVPPVLHPPAPSFESIAQRESINAGWIRAATTHHDARNPNGMPNPQLLDFQIEHVAAYIMSLRRQTKAQTGTCRAEIARLETVLAEARTNAGAAASAPESTAARLHRQPTPQSVAQAETEARNKIETALTLARRFESEGKDAECLAVIKGAASPAGIH